jgi:hypothetical protein
MRPDATAQTLRDRAANPPRDVSDILDMLHLGGVPRFANKIRQHLDIPERTRAEILKARQQN